ncbi:hypothetical protein F9802_13225 [Bacillus aerolatus]|uniref:Uncharacterized protein n=1 Tax=Bacillus aerolatus TaxID=2653354 RepID=A0A6I1FD78_9BACI|nr:hypothetical protein F9802_13225 [Bacillus aerolatus]
MARQPKSVFIGVLSQFVVMPLLAYALAKGLQLPPEVTKKPVTFSFEKLQVFRLE